jgi:hypothetical protein
MEQLGSRWTDFFEILYLIFFGGGAGGIEQIQV